MLNPVDKSEDLTRLSSAEFAVFVDQLRNFHDVAKRAAERETEVGAADIWQEAFEHLFPLPDVNEALTEAARTLPVPFVMPEIKVTATSRGNLATQFSGLNQIGPIPKNCDIRFEITNSHALAAGSQIFWIVRNEGREAEYINDLGHQAGTGLVANERSAYKGTHYMDCVVKVRSTTVATRRVKVLISGLEMPRRNPVSRPDWVKLRGKR